MKLFSNIFGTLGGVYDGLVSAIQSINPANGLPMVDDVHDIHMNHYGTNDNEQHSTSDWWSSSSSWDTSSSFDSSSSWDSNNHSGGF